MRQPLQKITTICFWLLATLDIIGIAENIDWLHFAVKPLLLPVLFFLLYFSKSTYPGKKFLLAGLFFSWLGDVFLLFEYKNALFFILGLASFLTTHILYISYFLRVRSANKSLLVKHPLLMLLVAAYGISLAWLLFPSLGDLKIPVVLYAVVICTMLLCSLHVFLKVNKKSGILYLLGAVAFVLSDSLLAINKFYQPFAFAGILIMLTYCTAQFLIVWGFIEQDRL